MKLSLVGLALCVSFGLGCLVGDDATPADGDGDDGEGFQPDAANAKAIAIGFDGAADQFAYLADFYKIDKGQSTTRLCHGYFQWNVGSQPAHSGDVTDTSSRAYLDNWLTAAEGNCDEVLIAFKSMSNRAAPDEADYATAFDNFVATDWKTETGYTGGFAFSPWNEPNNPAQPGNGLGVTIEASLSARYYLRAEAACRKHGCKVAAGDFASNGDMWNDFEWNCSNDNVATNELCNSFSDENSAHAAASYLDKYKNEIAQHANDAAYKLGDEFRPEYFAFHGWHDTNEYLDAASHCSTYTDCAARRIEKSLGGSWGHVVLWDTEDGMGQKGALSDHDQACGAAFLVRLASVTSRVKRVYITRLHGGTTEIAGRPALEVLANREQTYATDCK
ncbi:MAG TPA: hypothetical protein VGG74_18755 [Kofleriaceae bacterium]|jgi:hypothetical protein